MEIKKLGMGHFEVKFKEDVLISKIQTKKNKRDYANEVLSILTEAKSISLIDLRAQMKTSETHLYKALNKLEAEQKIEKEVINRQAIYKLKGIHE